METPNPIATQTNPPAAHSQQNTIACTTQPIQPEGINTMPMIANDPLTLIITLTALARAGTPLIRATKTLIRTLRDRQVNRNK